MLEGINFEDKNNFIIESKLFIYISANSICKKRLQWENDDELSIALIAFDKAIETYSSSRGNFYSYAKIVIRNSLIDYFRIGINNHLSLNDEEATNYFYEKDSISKYEIEKENILRCEEMEAYTIELTKYSITLEDLVDNSPSHIDAKEKLLDLAFLCSGNEEILCFIKKNKMLPIKKIILLTGIKRKYIEKWRKYLISVILILFNDTYKYMRSYLNISVGEK